jgi:ribosomal-protein-alanine N-acetyltransferase
MFPTVLEGEGLRLRMITEVDAPALYAFVSKPEVYEPTSSDGWTLESVEQFARDNVAGAAIGKWCRYGIVLRGGDAPIGSIGLFNIDLRNQRCEIGYDLAPDYWGKGLMTRAARPLLAWAFGEGGFNRVEATVMEGNDRSGRVLERLAFKREALLREYKFVRGEYKDYSMWSLLARDSP